MADTVRIGLIGCVALAFALPLASVLTGVAVVSVGGFVYWMRRWAA